MLANGVKETTTSSGTGTVTLSQRTGFTRFSGAFTNSTLVPYSIQDGNNWEWGIGTVGASNTLARSTITATLVSGTYTSTGATAITLSGSGSIVSCTQHTGSLSSITNVDQTQPVYILRSPFGIYVWRIIRGDGLAASPANNGSYTTAAAAWTARASLVYA